MPTFDWRESLAEADGEDWGETEWDALTARYGTARDARGITEWSSFVTELRTLAHQQQQRQEQEPERQWSDAANGHFANLVHKLRFMPAPVPQQPTVFVSHQRNDGPWANWVAWAATEAHFDYWLDIHDPALTRANTSTLPAPVKSVLIAGIIEIALLNATHLVSLQTKNALKSRWVPYEFGRAKERRSLAANAASWFEQGVTPKDRDYLWLASCVFTDVDLRAWLDRAGHTPPPSPNPFFPNGPPSGLPN